MGTAAASVSTLTVLCLSLTGCATALRTDDTCRQFERSWNTFVSLRATTPDPAFAALITEWRHPELYGLGNSPGDIQSMLEVGANVLESAEYADSRGASAEFERSLHEVINYVAHWCGRSGVSVELAELPKPLSPRTERRDR